MWNVLSKEMRKPALAAAACAAVILVASPVAAETPETVTSNVFHKRLIEECSQKNQQIKGNCMSKFKDFVTAAAETRRLCTGDKATCDQEVLNYWAEAYDNVFNK